MTNTERPYFYNSNAQIKTIVHDNWNKFNVLLEIHSGELRFRKTYTAIQLRNQIELRLRKIAYRRWNKPLILQKMRNILQFKKTKFAKDLYIEITQRLKELKLECFTFPSTELTGENKELIIIDRQKKGLLLAIGYRTGKIGLYEQDRRDILDSLYTKEIPKNTGVKGVEKWCAPKTGTRLYTIVYSIARLTKQEKGNTWGDYRISISEREADLKYLKKKYYDNRYDWIYPKT